MTRLTSLATSACFLFLTVAVTANDLIFIQGGACNLNLPHEQCGGAAAGSCCISAKPFCDKLLCQGCARNNDLYSFDKKGCTGNSHASCREPGGGAWCCLDLGGGDGCAGQWFVGGARKRSYNLNMERDAPTPHEELEDCETSYHPNKMVYTDNDGTRHEIHIPAKDYYKAHGHLQKEEWSELAKFPQWDNQQYTEADNLKKITDARKFYSVLPEHIATEDKKVEGNSGHSSSQ